MKEYNLRNEVFEKAEMIYGNPIPENVKIRLEWEVSQTEENGFEEVYKTAADIAGQISISGCSVRATTGCSLIAYLLGITDIDPIQYNLQPEFLMGLSGDKPPEIAVTVSYAQYNRVLYDLGLNESNYRESCDHHELAPRLSKSLFCDLIQEIGNKTSLQPEEISCEEAVEEFSVIGRNGGFDLTVFDDLGFIGDSDIVEEMILYLQPHTFDDYVKIFSAAHSTGTWEGMQREFVRAGIIKLDDFISSRDDVYDFLMQFDLDRNDVLKYSEDIRKGKGVSENLENFLLNEGVPEWKIIILNEMKYLFPRSHGISYMRLFWRMVYYRIQYGDVIYRECMNEIEDKFGNREFSFDSDNLNINLVMRENDTAYAETGAKWLYHVHVSGDVGVSILDFLRRILYQMK